MRRFKTKYLAEFFIHALFWLGVYYALRALTVSSFKMLVNNNDQVGRSMSMSMLFPYSKQVLVSLMILFYSNSFWLFNMVLRYKSRVLSAMVISGWSLLLYWADFLVIRWLITSRGVHFAANKPALPGPQPDLPGPPPVEPVNAVDWTQMQGTIALVFLSVLGVAIAYYFIKEWIRNDLARNEAQAQQLSAEIRFLRSQVNPHFLFNTLNTLFSMAQKKGNEELANGISKLSGMMRYMIYESNTDRVPLQKEIEYLTDCIALNKLRYADSEVTVNFHHPDRASVTRVKVAPMLFIPFLENAFKHGVFIGHTSGIDMTISVNQNKLIFTCANTDHSGVKKMHEEKGGIGLENVKRRLELIYPAKHELMVGKESEKYNIKLQIDLA